MNMTIRGQIKTALNLYRVSWVQSHCRWLSNPVTWRMAVEQYQDIKRRYPGVGNVVIGRV